MTFKTSLLLLLATCATLTARAETDRAEVTPVAQTKVLDLAQLAAIVAGQEVRIEQKGSNTVVTTAAEESYPVDEPAISVAEQICADHQRDYDLGQGPVLLCTARTLD